MLLFAKHVSILILWINNLNVQISNYIFPAPCSHCWYCFWIQIIDQSSFYSVFSCHSILTHFHWTISYIRYTIIHYFSSQFKRNTTKFRQQSPFLVFVKFAEQCYCYIINKWKYDIRVSSRWINGWTKLVFLIMIILF